MIVYKGTDKDMKCRGKQYALGETATEDHAELCKAGIHACEYPLDVFAYYVPGRGSRYFVGELDGMSDWRDVDTKVVGKKLTLKAEIGIPGLAKAAVEYITERIDQDKVESATNTGYYSAATNTGNYGAATNTGNYSAATNTGYHSAATNTGDHSAATNTGYHSAATNTGNYSAATNTGNYSAATNTGNHSAATNTGNHSAATNTGDYSAATNTGDHSAATNTGDHTAATDTGNHSAATNTGVEGFAIATGFESKASGALGCWLVLAEWALKDGMWHIIDAQCRRVDGNVIKPDTFYQLKGGVFVEWKEEAEA